MADPLETPCRPHPRPHPPLPGLHRCRQRQPHRRARPVLRLPRPQRRRQIHHHQDAHRPARPHIRLHLTSSARTSPATPSSSSARSASSPKASRSSAASPRPSTSPSSAACTASTPTTTRQRSEELLDFMSLTRESKKLVTDYSHGMQKKLALAAAVIHGPKVLFLDEPFEGVDAIAARHPQIHAPGHDRPRRNHLPHLARA